MVANAAEEAVAEELLPSEKLFITFVLEQDNDIATTSCFCVLKAKGTNLIGKVMNSIARGDFN